MKKITELAQDLLITDRRDCAIDFTCGQGFDTLFLAQHYRNVEAFDIQEEAIRQSKERTKEYSNITFH